MNKMLQKVRKNKKGFTLVELLVVLVILAILAAAIIPSMMGFIDKAREESAAAECRSAKLAAEIVVNEYYGYNKDLTGTGKTAMGTPELAEVNTVADFTGTATVTAVTVDVAIKDATAHPKIQTIAFTTSNGTNYTFSVAGGWVKAA